MTLLLIFLVLVKSFKNPNTRTYKFLYFVYFVFRYSCGKCGWVYNKSYQWYEKGFRISIKSTPQEDHDDDLYARRRRSWNLYRRKILGILGWLINFLPIIPIPLFTSMYWLYIPRFFFVSTFFLASVSFIGANHVNRLTF